MNVTGGYNTVGQNISNEDYTQEQYVTIQNQIITLTEEVDDLGVRVSQNETDIDGLETRVTQNETDIDGLETRVTQNETDIATNAGNIATNTSNIATNAANIATNTANIATNTANISTNTANIATNTANIATNTATNNTQNTTLTSYNTRITNLEAKTTDISYVGNSYDGRTYIFNNLEIRSTLESGISAVPQMILYNTSTSAPNNVKTSLFCGLGAGNWSSLVKGGDCAFMCQNTTGAAINSFNYGFDLIHHSDGTHKRGLRVDFSMSGDFSPDRGTELWSNFFDVQCAYTNLYGDLDMKSNDIVGCTDLTVSGTIANPGLTSLNSTVAGHTSTLSSHSTSISSLSTRMTTAETNITNLQTDVSSLQSTHASYAKMGITCSGGTYSIAWQSNFRTFPVSGNYIDKVATGRITLLVDWAVCSASNGRFVVSGGGTYSGLTTNADQLLISNSLSTSILYSSGVPVGYTIYINIAKWSAITTLTDFTTGGYLNLSVTW